ncbi:unnamed protein product [Brassica oleracea var. botrytis]|nr:unnamed protein product [Brassica oleracea]
MSGKSYSNGFVSGESSRFFVTSSHSPVRPVNAAAAAAIIIIKGMLNFFCLRKLRLSL